MGTAIAGRAPVTVAYTSTVVERAGRPRRQRGPTDFSQQVIYPPDTPDTPTVGANDTKLDAAWTAPVDGGSPRSPATPCSGAPIPRPRPAAIAAGQTADATTSPHQITGLTNGTEYFVRVIAVNAAGPGQPSPEQAATPMRGAPHHRDRCDLQPPSGHRHLRAGGDRRVHRHVRPGGERDNCLRHPRTRSCVPHPRTLQATWGRNAYTIQRDSGTTELMFLYVVNSSRPPTCRASTSRCR